jgi:predicted TIM-barrel fold metal-dependent hydrolase
MRNLVGEWIPDPALRRAVLVDNPARLYGFPRAAATGAFDAAT